MLAKASFDEQLSAERRGATAPHSLARLIYGLFFLSGVPALIYQLVWQRTLFRVFGVNIEAITIVVTAFMLGLGLGSLAGGWLSRQRNVPLLPLLAGIEILTGAFGLGSLDLIERAGHAALGLPLAGTAAVTLAVVLVPTLLMGATLPIVVGHLAPRLGDTGQAVGRLYYMNTLGAGAACFLVPLAIFPFSGMSTAILVAVVINALVAMLAIATHFFWRGNTAAPSQLRVAPARSQLIGTGTALALAAAGGFVSLSLEIFFVRIASFASGGSAWSFAYTLGAFLFGIAAGSSAVAEACERDGRDTLGARLFYRLLVAGALCVACLPVLGLASRWPPTLTALSLLFVFVVARAWGMLLPYLAEISVSADDRAGGRVALLYLANILGSAAGSLLTGFVLMDVFGLVGIAQILAGSGLVVALGLAAVTLRRSHRGGLALAAVVLIALATAGVPAMTSGVLERLQFKNDPKGDHLFSEVVENRSGIVAVDTTGTVWGNGMYDGRFNTDLTHDTNGVLRPYALSLFHPAPRRVLMIGFASGSWAQVLASHPQVESLTIVEINPAYLEIASRHAEVRSVLSNPKVRLVVDDGRRWLARHPEERFDAVVQNTTWHYRANVTNLLSQEYLGLVAPHLLPGGVFFYNTTGSERVQRTACATMPFGLRFWNHMVVANGALSLDFPRWRKTLEAYAIDGVPVVARDTAGQDLLDRLMRLGTEPKRSSEAATIESCAEIDRRTAGLPLVTNDNMGAEWQ